MPSRVVDSCKEFLWIHKNVEEAELVDPRDFRNPKTFQVSQMLT